MASRLVTTLAVGTALTALLVACGRTEQVDSIVEPSPTFPSGLTAEELMERARQAGDSIHSVRIEWTDQSEFLGEQSESAIEMILVDDDQYMKMTDEDGVSELLHYGGRWYTRSSSGAPWEPDPDLEGVLAQLPGLAEEVLSDPSFSLTRLDDDVIDGQQVFRVHAELASRATDIRTILEDLVGADGEIPPLPEELLPDEASVTGDFWIGADDLNIYRWTYDTVLYNEGNPISSSRRVAEASAFNEQLELPGPLPDG
jgi:hypothetical protein